MPKQNALQPKLRDLVAVSGDILQEDIQPSSIGFFGLGESTALKRSAGHTESRRQAIRHNAICRRIAEAFGAQMIKELGDGALIAFPRSVDAMLAALNVREAIDRYTGFTTRIGLTTGAVEVVELSGGTDLLGHTVDRCARLQALAQPTQIIIDETFYTSIRSIIKDYRDISVTDPVLVRLRDIGEVCIRGLQTARNLDTQTLSLYQPFDFRDEGRYEPQDQVQFIQTAQREVIHLGLGLKSFTDLLFTAEPEERYRSKIKAVIKRGVVYRFYVADPDSPDTLSYLEDRQEVDYLSDIRRSIKLLHRLREECAEEAAAGRVEVYKYRHIPYYHALGIDIGETSIDSSGRMVVSNYLYGISRVNAPVMFFSVQSRSRLFETYWTSLHDLTRNAEPAF
jgi:hypothetical protein